MKNMLWKRVDYLMLISRVFPNMYRDSVFLMKIAGQIRKLDGVENAEVMMATVPNKAILKDNELLAPEIEKACANDLVISVRGTVEKNLTDALEKAQDFINKGVDDTGGTLKTVRSLSSALVLEPQSNLALISIPGTFVKREASKLLNKGLNLMIFSDNVSIEDELEIKQLAREKDLLVMGPDCGTAIIDGVALAFANKVNKGSIGIVGASGTGIQEVTVLLHNMGLGISHAIGTGGNDVSDKIKGISLLHGLHLLENDKNTEIIVVVSKPPGAKTSEYLTEKLKKCNKPVIVNFLGKYEKSFKDSNIIYTTTLEETAYRAAEIAGMNIENKFDGTLIDPKLKCSITKLSSKQRYLRGLYTGGTLATEAAIICREQLSDLSANLFLRGIKPINNLKESQENMIVDMGADEFTLGKPHPMIDPIIKNERILQESLDNSTAVLLLDFVLGYGVHPDPVGVTIPYILKARQNAIQLGNELIFIASVTGTDDDPQVREKQVQMLQNNGVVVLNNNACAARQATNIILSLNRR